MEAIDAVHLSFNPSSLVALNVILALVMFGVALELKVEDFKRVLVEPRAGIVGLTTQLFLLPAATFLLTLVLDLPPSVELGMLLVAACPGGNVSNFMTSLAGGNTSLSISMTAVVTALAIVTTPFNVSFWGALNPNTATILKQVSIDPVQMVSVVALIIGIPVVLGMVLHTRKPELAARMVKPFKIGSLCFLALFILIALAKNAGPAKQYLPQIAGIVIGHNLLALGLGRLMGELARLGEPEKRTLTIEVGIQNSGLGLVLIFSFFNGLGGMAVVAAFWGIWHLVSGLTLARFWRRRMPTPTPELTSA